MATSSLIRLSAAPDAPGPVIAIVVQYDGDNVPNDLEMIIDRDGYAAVYRTFAEQQSRNWRELNPDVTEKLPEHVTQFHQNLEVSAAVAGYGVLYVGKLCITPDEIGHGTRYARNITYHVDRKGNISVPR